MYNVLLVEDDVIMLRALTRFLEKEGFRIDMTANGKEAIQKVEENQYDLVITDLMMPFANGYEVISKVKSIDHYKEVPIIVITSMGNEDAITECYKIGADDFIRKPVMPQELHVRIKKVMGILQ